MSRVGSLFSALRSGVRFAGGNPPAAKGDVERDVDALLSPLLERDLISGSILIARRGKVLLAKGYGLANREHGIPNTPDTRFRIGSISKQFTSMAIFLLAQEGALRLEDPLSRYLPGYPRGDEITLHMLLTHTSGIPSYNALEGYAEQLSRSLGIDEAIAFFEEEPLEFTPGGSWAYSNSGYVLLAKVIELASGICFAGFLWERIFKPLKMWSSGIDEFTVILPGRATGHGNRGDGVYRASYRYMPFSSGASSMYSTVRDLHRWDRALHGEALLEREGGKRMMTPVIGNYACGWYRWEERGRVLVEHSGAVNGFQSQISRYPEEELLIVSLFNLETALWRRVNGGLSSIALGEECEPALHRTSQSVSVEQLESYAGTYRLRPGVEIVLALEEGDLTVHSSDRPVEIAVPQSATLFFLPASVTLMKVEPIEGTSVPAVQLQRGAGSSIYLPTR
jgi:CubicO group peptidase (beta-lactamase class C family)